MIDDGKIYRIVCAGFGRSRGLEGGAWFDLIGTCRCEPMEKGKKQASGRLKGSPVGRGNADVFVALQY
jgi:hypothetical protein